MLLSQKCTILCFLVHILWTNQFNSKRERDNIMAKSSEQKDSGKKEKICPGRITRCPSGKDVAHLKRLLQQRKEDEDSLQICLTQQEESEMNSADEGPTLEERVATLE